METSDFCVLVQGPEWGDVQFYGEWLLAAAKAQLFWTDAVRDEQFAKAIERLGYEPHFGMAATAMLMNLREHLTTFVLDLDSEEGEELVMMVGIGLFVQSGHICRMTIPSTLTSETVKNAALAFARTEDRKCMLHPERLVSWMSAAEAKLLQKQLGLLHGSRHHPRWH